MISIPIGDKQYPVLQGTGTFLDLAQKAAKAASALPEGHPDRVAVEQLFSEKLCQRTSVVELTLDEYVERMDGDLLNQLALTSEAEDALGAQALEEHVRHFEHDWDAIGQRANDALLAHAQATSVSAALRERG